MNVPGSGRRTQWGVAAILTLLLVAGAVWYFREDPSERAGRLLDEARQSRKHGDSAEAERAAVAVLKNDPGSLEAAVIAAESAVAQAEFQRAADYLDQANKAAAATDGDRDLRLRAALLAAEVNHHRLHRLSEAERWYRTALAIDAEHRDANIGLAKLLGLCGRRDEAVPHVLRLVRQGEVTDLLILIARSSGAIRDPESLEAARQAAPRDPCPLIGLAWQASSAEDGERAVELLRQAVQLDPDSVAAQAALGVQLLDGRQFDELIRWEQHLPNRADDNADVWFVRGRMAEEDDQPQAAIRCYGEAVRHAPEMKVANYHLARLLAEDGKPELSQQFAERLGQLQRLEQVQDGVLFSEGHDSIAPLLELIDAYEAAGRLWEAYGWTLLAVDIAPADPATRKRLNRLSAKVDGLPLRLSAVGVSSVLPDLSSYPLPRFERSAPQEITRDGDESASMLSFRNDAEAAGLQFQYVNGTSGTSTRRMFEFTGGGIGVVDFDRDGYSDAWFTQGRLWDAASSSREHGDELFRNLDGKRFRSVTDVAGIDEAGFGQGVTVGDFDADGFPDVYVANIGGNRLWRNNGDGTFTDVTDQAGLAGTDWTTSCLMADLDGDRLPDLYDVNYVTGDDVFERICRHADGSPAICMPFDFDEQPDRVWRNVGDGRFVEATSELLGDVPGGKGLGIAAWNADGSGRLSVMVANDTTPSFFFTPTQSTAGVPLLEQGIPAGLAFNGAGKATGCMGIALGDVNGDQQFDIFVTNFLAEPNSLFSSVAPGLYEDRTRAQGLHEPSLETLGFGTQFLDADLDGRLELFVANGHIDDLRRFGKPYKMRAQVFRQRGNAFAEVASDTLGPYFEQTWLGRPVARLDWNRDGREDLAVGHLETPSVLLTNTTPATGRFLSLELTGTTSSRDAIGTIIEVRIGDQTLVRQITAGDGYQASNERRVHFGLGETNQIDELVVRWPSGTVQTFTDVPASRGFSLTEGRRLLPLP